MVLLFSFLGIIVFCAGILAFDSWAKKTGRAAKWHAEAIAKAQRLQSLQAAPAKNYAKRPSLLSNAEKAFHAVLTRAVPEAAVFPKVRVADVVAANERFSASFLKISQKHFDWVLCHPVSFEPLLAIELDDSSHANRRQALKDADKDTAAREAGLKLLRVPYQRQYDENALRTSIAALINSIP